MFNSVSQFCQNYYDQLPVDGLKAAGLSAVLSFTASVTIITLSTPLNQAPNNLSRAGLAAGIAFLAATIHALTTPIFNYLFDNPNNQTFNGFQETIKILIDITLTHILINHTTAFKVNLITAINIQDGNFIILPSNIVQIPLDMLLRALNWVDPALFSHIRNYCCQPNYTPVYVAI